MELISPEEQLKELILHILITEMSQVTIKVTMTPKQQYGIPHFYDQDTKISAFKKTLHLNPIHKQQHILAIILTKVGIPK